MRVLVTGSSGQIGSYVVDALKSESHQVVGLDRRESPWTSLIGDVRNLRDCQNAIKSCEAVIHLAAQVSVQESILNPIEDLEHNLKGTVNLLDCARSEDLPIVVTSSAVVYGNPTSFPIKEEDPTDPLSPYGMSKRAGEDYARLFMKTYGIRASIVRPFNVYSIRQDSTNPYTGVLSKFAERVTHGKQPIIFGTGKQTRDFIHAADVARLLSNLSTGILSIGSEPVVNVASGTETSILELARLFQKAVGLQGAPEFKEPRAGEVVRSVADVRRLQGLGFRPQIDLSLGVQELVSGRPLTGKNP